MSAQLKNLVEEMSLDAKRSVRRLNMQEMIESLLVEFRPDLISAAELLSALKVGLEARLDIDGGLPLEVEYAFEDLRKAMDASWVYEPDPYDSIGYGDQYAGPEGTQDGK